MGSVRAGVTNATGMWQEPWDQLPLTGQEVFRFRVQMAGVSLEGPCLAFPWP